MMENQLEGLIKQGFERIGHQIPDALIDIKYFTEDNFVGKAVYDRCYDILRAETLDKLKKASDILRLKGYRLVIWDAYRPLAVQALFWNLIKDPRFVAPPERGSVHNRGCAVDLWLADLEGAVFEPPSAFDEFSDTAGAYYPYRPAQTKLRLEALQSAMVSAGFSVYEGEWWHFTDVDFQQFDLI